MEILSDIFNIIMSLLILFIVAGCGLYGLSYINHMKEMHELEKLKLQEEIQKIRDYRFRSH